MVSAADILSLATQQIGVTEYPANSNRQKYGAWYGLNGVPWCRIFEEWLFAQFNAESALFGKTAGVYATQAIFKRIGRFYSSPQVGDLAIYDYGQGHTGIVESFTATTITAIEGNTSPGTSGGSQYNGGCVARKVRLRDKHILGYCRPGYSTTPTPNPAPQSSEDDMHNAACTIRWQDGSTIEVTEDGAMLGAGCTVFGSFYSLTAAEKANVPNPPSPYSLRPARTVPVVYQTPDGKNVIVELPDKNGGVIASIIGKDGKVNEFKFDAAFAGSHK